MSSATSTSEEVRLPSEAKTARRDAAFQPWHFFILASLVAATFAVVLSRTSTPEHLVLMSLTIAAAGLAAAGLYRMLAPLVFGEQSVHAEPLSERSRAALEREKTLALRSLKELEFDRSMMKLSQKDFDEMAGRLRARAISLMKQLDDGTVYRTIIERELSARLAHAPAGSPSNSPAIGNGLCSCGTTNDSDAIFCKRCGAKLHDTQSGAGATQTSR
jgi:hypothetical protein